MVTVEVVRSRVFWMCQWDMQVGWMWGVEERITPRFLAERLEGNSVPLLR